VQKHQEQVASLVVGGVSKLSNIAVWFFKFMHFVKSSPLQSNLQTVHMPFPVTPFQQWCFILRQCFPNCGTPTT